MEYKRKEMFRMVFSNPYEAQATRIQQDESNEVPPVNTIYLHDISLHGAKVESPEEYTTTPKASRLLLQFQLNEKLMSVIGDVVWRKSLGRKYHYGIHFDIDSQIEKDLLWELKVYAKRNLQRK